MIHNHTERGIAMDKGCTAPGPLYRLREIASILRSEGGCAWDREQTSQTLKPYLIEEAYEVYDAIESGNSDHLREELGDLLYQVYAHAQIAGEKGEFTIDDVADGIIAKLIGRHPHVFGDEKVESSKQVIENWENIKKREKSRSSVLEGVPNHLPALLKSYRVQQKVSRVGFDWTDISDVIGKLEEEVGELREALAKRDEENIAEEIGDILFSMANISRFIGINPEEALLRTIDKFMKRFRIIEAEAARSGREILDMSLAEMDEIWERAKNRRS